MNFSSNFNNQSFTRIYPKNNQFFNLRYFPKDSNNNLELNNPYSKKELFKSKEKDYFDKLTKEDLDSLKLYNPNIKSQENEKEEEKIDKSSFISIKELITKDFEKIARIKDFDSLKKYLPQMISQNYQNKGLISKNTQINSLLNNYQEVLKYLLDLEKKMNKFNSLLEQNAKNLINVDLNNYGKEKTINEKLAENEKKIKNLLEKIDKYKKAINSAKKNKKKSLSSFILFIKDKDNNYYCDLCPNEIFQTFKDVQTHSLNRHKHILKLRKQNYEINNNTISPKNNLDRNYIDNKMNNFRKEINNFIEGLNIKTIFKKRNDTNSENDQKSDFDINRGINEKDFTILQTKMNILEDNQKKNQDILLENLDEFKKEIFSKIKNLKNNQPVVFEETKDIKNESKENLSHIKENLKNINNNFPINNLKHSIHERDIDKLDFELGKNYQEDTSIFESYNNYLKKEENDKGNKYNIKDKVINIFNPMNKGNDYFNTNKENNLNKKDNYEVTNKNQIKINSGNKNKLKFEINPDNKLNPNINNFAKSFFERENNILYNQKINGNNFYENYKILSESKNVEYKEKNKEDDLIKKLSEEYKLNEQNLSKSGYNNIINEIINKNENVKNENYKTQFNNIISFLEINKDLNLLPNNI